MVKMRPRQKYMDIFFEVLQSLGVGVLRGISCGVTGQKIWSVYFGFGSIVSTPLKMEES